MLHTTTTTWHTITQNLQWPRNTLLTRERGCLQGYRDTPEGRQLVQAVADGEATDTHDRNSRGNNGRGGHGGGYRGNYRR